MQLQYRRAEHHGILAHAQAHGALLHRPKALGDEVHRAQLLAVVVQLLFAVEAVARGLHDYFGGEIVAVAETAVIGTHEQGLVEVIQEDAEGQFGHLKLV